MMVISYFMISRLVSKRDYFSNKNMPLKFSTWTNCTLSSLPEYATV